MIPSQPDNPVQSSTWDYKGLTKREYFAGLMMAEQSRLLIDADFQSPERLARFAKHAVLMADALLDELGK